MVFCFSIYYYTFRRKTHSWQGGQKDGGRVTKSYKTTLYLSRHNVYKTPGTHTFTSLDSPTYTDIKYVIKNFKAT